MPLSCEYSLLVMLSSDGNTCSIQNILFLIVYNSMKCVLCNWGWICEGYESFPSFEVSRYYITGYLLFATEVILMVCSCVMLFIPDIVSLKVIIVFWVNHGCSPPFPLV